MRKLSIGIGVLLLVAAAIFAFYQGNGKGAGFKTIPVSTGTIKATVTATGAMNAVTTVLVGTQVSGTIKKLYVDFNSRVKKEQIIAEIDPATFQAQVDQARANLLAAKANVEKARATLTDSRRTRDRNRELFSRNLIARSDLDSAEATYDANNAALNAAEAQVAQNQASLRFAETNLTYTKIVSPVNGIVVSRNVDVGQTVAASFQTPTLFTIAQDLTKMQIDTNIDEADIGKIKIGQETEFTVDAYPDRTFKGAAHQIRIAPITVQNVVTYDVVITVDNTDLALMPGMTANVSVIVASKEGVLKVPNAALRFKPTEKDKANTKEGLAAAGGQSSGPQTGKKGGQAALPATRQVGRSHAPRGYGIWILENGTPKRVTVTLGISDGSFTEVTSGELKEGQEVIVESLAKVAKNNNAAQPGPPRFIH